jgi:hypothetical protein
VAGTSTVTVTVTDGTLSDSKTYTLTVAAAPTPASLALGSLAADTIPVGTLYEKTIPYTYENGTGTLAFTATGLPVGFSINPATSKITGTAAATGVFTVTVTVTDGTLSDIGSYTLTIVPAAYTITAAAGPGGSISPTGPVNVAYGKNQTFTITSDPDYTISNVLVDGVSVGAVPTYTFSNVTATHAISVSFTFTGSISPAVYPVLEHFDDFTGSGTSSARVDSHHAKFVRLTLDGQTVDPAHYTVTGDTITITLKESYLKTLDNGTYVYVAEFTDGTSENIRLVVNVAPVVAEETPPTLALTGGNVVSVWWIGLLSLVAGVVCVLVRRRAQRLEGTW